MTWEKIKSRLARAIHMIQNGIRPAVHARLGPTVSVEGLGFIARKEVIRCLMVQ